MLKKALFALPLLLLGAVLLFAGCGQSSSTPSTPHGTTAYVGTQSPGDVWSWTLGEGTLIATNETTTYYYSGTFSTLPSGFLKGVITSTSDPAVPTDGTGIFYMLEYPNTMLLVSPGDGRLIACASRATGSLEAGQYNFVKFPYPGWTTSHKAYGTVEVTQSSSLYNFYITSYKLNGDLKEIENETGYQNTDGRLIRTGSSLEVFMTPSGIFHGDSTGSAGFAGVKYEVVDPADVIAKDYRGVLFDYDSSSGHGDILPIGAGPHPTVPNSLRGWSYTNIETNAIDTSGYVTLTLGPQDSSGVLSGTMVTKSGGSKLFKMVVAKISGKYVVIGIDAADDHHPENFLVVQQ